jgi:hypothetical protein
MITPTIYIQCACKNLIPPLFTINFNAMLDQSTHCGLSLFYFLSYIFILNGEFPHPFCMPTLDLDPILLLLMQSHALAKNPSVHTIFMWKNLTKIAILNVFFFFFFFFFSKYPPWLLEVVESRK